MTTTIATWNINSVRLRLPLLAEFTREYTPDIVCLQETKVEDDKFPLLELQALGYPHVAFSGQKSYNGVAILSKLPLRDLVVMDVLGNQEKRHISATLPDGTQLHNFYVPAGGDIPDVEQNPKFNDKLAFVDAMRAWSDAMDLKTQKVIFVGDINIAPHEHDVWSHKQLLGVVSHTPEETSRLLALQEAGSWVDTARVFTPLHEKLYSWWSYRNRDWLASNRGRRLDHIWASPALKAAVRASVTIQPWRGKESPSDHVPVITTFAF